MGVREGIETAEDLKGGTITGGSLAGRNTWIMRQVLTKMGLDPDKDVSFVPSSGGSDSRLGALLNGSVDGASLFPRHEAFTSGILQAAYEAKHVLQKVYSVILTLTGCEKGRCHTSSPPS